MSESTITGARTEAPGARTAGPAQTAVLVAASCLSVLGAVLLAPVLPDVQRAFRATPGAAALVPLVLTVPALVIGLLAPLAGRVVDAVGRRRVLVAALCAYAVVGTAPLWLASLPLILVSRVGVGVAESMIMTCCTTLLADYFTGERRDRALGLQTIVTTLAATAFFVLGGALGSASWRTPFWLYAVSLPLAALVAAVVFTPSGATAERSPAVPARSLPPLPWRSMRLQLLVTLFGGVVFYALIVELSYVLHHHGVRAAATLGQLSALASLATAAGAFTFGRVSRRGPRVLLVTAFAAAGVGLLVVGFAGTTAVVVVGAVVCSAGTGLLLPSLLTWSLGGLPYERRGRGTGRWTAALFLGEFACPLVLLALERPTGGLEPALAALGGASLVVALVLAPVLRAGAPAPASATVGA